MFEPSLMPPARSAMGATAPVTARASFYTGPRWGYLDDLGAVVRASEALARGAVVAHGFGQFYVLTTRPDARTVGQMNLWKGRPVDQVVNFVGFED